MDLATKTAPGEPDSRDWFALAAIFAVAFVFNLLIPRDLWVQDEARYGEVVREMLAGGNWLIPHLNAYPYPDKPVLYFWLVALLGGVVGHGEFAFRLLTVFATGLSVTGVYMAARELIGRREAFWSALLFATMFLSLIVGQIARMDMLLASAAVFAWYFLIRFWRTGARGHIALFWVLTTLAVGIKGPIALLFTALPAIVWFGLERKWRGLAELRLLFGSLILAGLVGAWFLAVVLQGQEQYLLTIWQEQLVGRTINSWSHKEPFYFYLLLAPLLFMPWTSLVVLGARQLVRQRPDYLLPVAAFSLVPLLGISLISGKLFIYMQPLLPAVCVAGAVGASTLARRPKVSGWIGMPPVVTLALGGGALLWASPHYLPDMAWQGQALGAGLILLAAAGGILALQPGQTWIRGWAWLFAGVSVLLVGVMGYVLNPLFSARALGESVARHAGAGAEVGVINSTRGVLNYYAGRTFTELRRADVAAWWDSHPHALLVMQARDLPLIAESGRVLESCRVHEVYRFEFKEYHVVSACGS
jgi:4-amino-4-deoxy-L-arabinose transferase-like glycosyltransferase